MSMANARSLAMMVALPCVAWGCGPVGSAGGSSAPETDAAAAGKPRDGGGAGAPSDGGPESASPQNDARAPDGYAVSGNTIYDSSGQPPLFHGVDRPSLEWSPLGEQPPQ